MLATAFVLIIGVSLTVMAQIPLKGKERLLLWAGFAAHVFGAFALVFVTRDIYGYGDMLTYFRKGGEGVLFVQQDFARWFPEVIKTILHQPSALPHEWAVRGDATGSMAALATMLRLFFGDSLHAACLFCAFGSFSGKYAIYLVFREMFPKLYRLRLALVCFLFPSVVFWSSGLLKEAIAFFGLGWLFYGGYKLLERKFFTGVPLVLLGGLFVGISKAYILFPFVVGWGGWLFWRRAINGRRALLPVYVAIGLAVAFGGIILLGQLFPRYAVDQIAEETATLQSYGTASAGGSNYKIVSGEERSILGQLAFAPIAVVSTLLRPFIFEVRNAMSAINAFETTTLLLMILGIVWRRKLSEIWKLVSSSPTLIFCIAFVFAFSIGVGLATTNLGTLSRYRIPMMPFYGAILMTLLPLTRWEKDNA